MARGRPFLWRNHREAINQGYLTRGVSAAISFPTGGGKSTLAELKIAASLLRGEKVIFLAPTHALVGQTTKALQKTFERFEVAGDLDDDAVLLEALTLAQVTVTTPERCLMLFSVDPEAFVDLGLIVFDECHLIHPRPEDKSRRSLDAMLALLNLTDAAKKADLLLISAMMKNTIEIASWIKDITGNECLALDLSWKPTRQVRGCVVYPASQIRELNTFLDQTYRSEKKLTLPAAAKRQLLANPFGLFGLLQTWSTTNREDYALLPILAEAQQLSCGTKRKGGWYLTPNGNKVSTAIAAASAAASMKTLVFLQTTTFCESCAKDYRNKQTAIPIVLTEDENAWRKYTIEEMGGSEFCYLDVDEDGQLLSGCATHHSLLIRQERELHESLFRRKDGINVLFATSTLAQGMNLPSEVVLICGDSRFDQSADKMQRLQAYELLNAAGRAGRAGEGAQGFVLLVPSKVIEFDNVSGTVGSEWLNLQTIFEQADQCLIIDDPLTGILDRIHEGSVNSGPAAYLLSKIPRVSADTDDTGMALLSRSFAVFRAKAAGNFDWVESRLKSANDARKASELPDRERWLEKVAASTGINVDTLREIVGLLDRGSLIGTTENLIKVILDWISSNPIKLLSLVRPESFEELLGGDYTKLVSDTEKGEKALKAVMTLLPLWMSGAPLCSIEAAFLNRTEKLGKCEYARYFIARIVPDLAFLAGLPARLIAARDKAFEITSQASISIKTLGSVVREGCNSAEALAVRINCGRSVSRVAARKRFDAIRGFAGIGFENEEFEQTRDRMRLAEESFMIRSYNAPGL